MTERRLSFRGRTLKGGFIVLSERAPKLECTVRNFSKAGAALRGVHHLWIAATYCPPLPVTMANRRQDRRCLGIDMTGGGLFALPRRHRATCRSSASNPFNRSTGDGGHP